MPTAPVGPYVKLVRAHKQLRRAEKLYAAWESKDPYRILVHHDTEKGEYVYRLERVHAPNSSIEMIIEEAIYHMRSSLDHLVCALLPGSTRGRGFPIFIDDPYAAKATSRTRDGWANLTKGLGQDAMAVLKAFQPYQDRDEADQHPLSRLNQLSILYKHISVEQIAVRIVGRTLPGIRMMGEGLEHGAVCATVPDSYDRAEVDPYLRIFPSFDVSGVGSGSLFMSVDGLRDIHTYICAEILPAFAVLFD